MIPLKEEVTVAEHSQPLYLQSSTSSDDRSYPVNHGENRSTGKYFLVR